MSADRLYIVTDATLDGGTAGIAAVLLDGETKNPLFILGKKVEAANIVEGELQAILFALEEIPQNGMKITLQSDSQNAVKYLKHELRATDSTLALVLKILRRVQNKNLDVDFVWQPRQENAVADAVAAVSTRAQQIWVRA